MKISDIFLEHLQEGKGSYLVTNQSGDVKRFKNADSEEAKTWAGSTKKEMPKGSKPEKYSDLWWEDRFFSRKYSGKYPDDKILDVTLDDLENIPHIAVGNEADITVGKKGKMLVGDTTCATADLSIFTKYSRDDDLGLDKDVEDLIKIRIRRDIKNPEKLVFVDTL